MPYFLVMPKVSSNLQEALDAYNKTTSKKLTLIVLADKKQEPVDKPNYELVVCDTKKYTSIEKALRLYKDEIIGMTAYGEDGVRMLARVIPHVPYVLSPTEQSLRWATSKIAMRELFRLEDKQITPPHVLVQDESKQTVDKILKEVGLPLVIKPTGLAASLLVTKCYHEEELREGLKKIFKKLRSMQKKTDEADKSQILVEGFMEGTMYSIDAYVTAKGQVYFCPMVYIKTGQEIGFDDFFNYLRITPTQLSEKSIAEAETVAQKTIHALGLRNTTAHIELMRTEDGWKVIEVGARMGGFRQELYGLSIGINHRLNDMLIHLGKKPMIPKEIPAYAAALKFYGKTEGFLTGVKGLKKIESFESFALVRKYKKNGDRCRFAKHGDIPVLDVVLKNTDRSQLLADIRRVEKTIEISIEK